MEVTYYQSPDLSQEPSFYRVVKEFVTSFCAFRVVELILMMFLGLGLILLYYRSPSPGGMIGFFSFVKIFIFGDAKDYASWYGWIDKNKRMPGDHIYSWRLGCTYAHHGICARDGNVIHFARGAGQGYGTGTGLEPFIFNSSPLSFDNPMNPCPRCGDQSNLEGVISSCIDCFLSGGDLYLFQYSVRKVALLIIVGGTIFPSEPPEDVLNHAEVLLHTNGFGVYNILNNNCENFASYCKTGLRLYSKQLTKAYGVIKVLVERLRLWLPWLFGVMIVLMISLLVPCGPC